MRLEESQLAQSGREWSEMTAVRVGSLRETISHFILATFTGNLASGTLKRTNAMSHLKGTRESDAEKEQVGPRQVQMHLRHNAGPVG